VNNAFDVENLTMLPGHLAMNMKNIVNDKMSLGPFFFKYGVVSSLTCESPNYPFTIKMKPLCIIRD
jgi:hypothetical protein